MIIVLWLLLGFVFPPAVTLAWLPFNSWLLRRFSRKRYSIRQFITDWFWTALIQLAIWVLASHDARLAAGAGASAAVAAAAWWWKRKRRRALALLGAKSRARIAAMTARMRERPARPALRPVPQGGAR